MEMKTQSKFVGVVAVLLTLSLVPSAPAQEEKKAEKKGEEKKAAGEEKKTEEKKAAGEEKKTEEKKAKAEKVSGDIGLLDTEKNYMIVVTKDGKLVTLDFNPKTKVTELKEKPTKMSDIGLGASATVQYTQKGDKNYVNSIEYLPAKGGD
jgi:sRNA-binding protein